MFAGPWDPIKVKRPVLKPKQRAPKNLSFVPIENYSKEKSFDVPPNLWDLVDLSLILVLEVDSTTSTTFSTNSDVCFDTTGPSAAPQAQVSCFIQIFFAPHS